MSGPIDWAVVLLSLVAWALLAGAVGPAHGAHNDRLKMFTNPYIFYKFTKFTKKKKERIITKCKFTNLKLFKRF